jgi:3-methyladenine DNA glycosylase/8-oxoguanine DNA glycosylase
MQTMETVVEPVAPFNFDGTVHVPHYFPTPDYSWQSGTIWRTLNFQQGHFGLKMENAGSIDCPKIRLRAFSPRGMGAEVMDKIPRELDWRYGFSEDLASFYREFENDRFLKPVFKHWRGMRVNCENSLYELMIISIVLQNATVKRTVQMMSNLFEAYGSRLKFDGKELFAYWNPEDLDAVSEEELRLLKVGYRAKMIKQLSEAFARKEIDELRLRKMSTEEAKKALFKLPGVGPATAQIILSGYLRRYDDFDLKGRRWEQKILSRTMYNRELVNADKIVHDFNERYGKWRGLAFHYIFTDLFWRHEEKKIPWLEKEIRI